MIESKIVKWIDLSESMQNLDIYGKKGWLKLFSVMKVFISGKRFSSPTIFVLILLFFLQIWMLNLTKVNDDLDTSLIVINYLRNAIFIQTIVKDNSSYKIAIIINSLVTFIYIACFIFVLVSIKIEKFITKFPLEILNFINILYIKYFIGPIIQINLLFSNCDSSNNNIYLNAQCYSDISHITIVILSLINLISSITLTIVLTIYYNEIGSLNEVKSMSRVSCLYEFYINLMKILMFIFSYLVQYYSQSDTWNLLFKIYMFVNCFLMTIYVNKHVLFYDFYIDSINHYGWLLTTWWSFIIFIKHCLNLSDTLIFNICGFVFIVSITYYLKKLKEDEILTEMNIFEAKSVKEIELYILYLNNILSVRNNKNKTILMGILYKFEEIVKNDENLNETYEKLMESEYLKKKFMTNTQSLKLFSMIYIIYNYHLEKSPFKDEILLPFCYFLINKFRNIEYACYLCSTMKTNSHLNMYFKYLLMEDIEDYSVNKLIKSNNKDDIKNIEISNAILYNIYFDLFREKIYESTCYKIEYFDIIKSNVLTQKMTDNFLSLGEKILDYRKQIYKLFSKLISINPFSDSVFRIFTTYVRDIVQDEISYRNESKKYNNIKISHIHEKFICYNNLFQENSCVILFDGYSSFGKILYTTPNFPQLFDFNNKEAVNLNLGDLCPSVLKEFHQRIMRNLLRYENLKTRFPNHIDLLLKGKIGYLFNISAFVKSIPNMYYGLIFIANVVKCKEEINNVVLDSEMKINGFTKSLLNYSIDRSYFGYYFAFLVPEFLMVLRHSTKDGFYFTTDEFKGNLNSYINIDSNNVNSYFKFCTEKLDILMKNIKKDQELDEFQLRSYLQELNKLQPKKIPVLCKISVTNYGNTKYIKVRISQDFVCLQENSNLYSNKHFTHTSFYNRRASLKRESILLVNESKIMPNEIKIKAFNLVSGNDVIALKDEEERLVDMEEEKNNMNKDNNQFNPNNNCADVTIQSDHSQKSISSSDSASFYRLKNTILDNKEVSPIKIMRYLSFIFGISSIILIVFAMQSTTSRFLGMNEYIDQNRFFNHTKIYISGLYFSTLNLGMIKNSIYQKNRFDIFDNYTYFTLNLMKDCIIELVDDNQKRTSFKTINSTLKIPEMVTLQKIENNDTGDSFSFPVNLENLLNILISYGLNLNANMKKYNTSTSLDLIALNIMHISDFVLKDPYFKDLNIEEKKKVLQERYFQTFSSINVIVIIIFVLIMISFVFYICKLFSIQISYLSKIIKFKNASFDKYVKNLENIKKELRSDNNDDDEKIEGDLDQIKNENEDDDSEKKKKTSKDEKRNKTFLPDQDFEKSKTLKDAKTKKNSNKKKLKSAVNISKEKERIMSKYFLKWNIFFCLKLIVIIIISGSYHLINSIIDQYSLNDFLVYDSLDDLVSGIFTYNVLLYTQIKIQITNYALFEVSKNNSISFLTKNPNSTVLFNGKNYSNIQNLMNTRYQMSVPKKGYYNTFQYVDNTFLNILQNNNNPNSSLSILNTLFYDNACNALFTNNSTKYTYCSSFASQVLQKGFSKGSNFLSILIDIVLDEMESVNVGTMNFNELINGNKNDFKLYEEFIEVFLFGAFKITYEILKDLNTTQLDSILKLYKTFMIFYICLSIFLFFALIFLVYKSKTIFSKFMNFLGIIPARYLIEDINLYKDILKLEKYI